MHRNQPTTEKPEANNSRITGPEEPQKAQDPTKELAQKREEPKQRKHQNTQLLSWCFEPSQPQKITSGLNTYFTLSPSYSFHKSLYHKSCFFEAVYIPRALNTGTCIQQGDLFYSAGLHRSHVLATANTEKKSGRGFGNKMQVNGPEG